MASCRASSGCDGSTAARTKRVNPEESPTVASISEASGCCGPEVCAACFRTARARSSPVRARLPAAEIRLRPKPSPAIRAASCCCACESPTPASRESSDIVRSSGRPGRRSAAHSTGFTCRSPVSSSNSAARILVASSVLFRSWRRASWPRASPSRASVPAAAIRTPRGTVGSSSGNSVLCASGAPSCPRASAAAACTESSESFSSEAMLVHCAVSWLCPKASAAWARSAGSGALRPRYSTPSARARGPLTSSCKSFASNETGSTG